MYDLRCSTSCMSASVFRTMDANSNAMPGGERELLSLVVVVVVVVVVAVVVVVEDCPSSPILRPMNSTSAINLTYSARYSMQYS